MMQVTRVRDDAKCLCFSPTLTKSAKDWWKQLAPRSIDSWKDLQSAFCKQFIAAREKDMEVGSLTNVKQKPNETFGVPLVPTTTTTALSFASQTPAPSLSLLRPQFSPTIHGPTASSLIPTQTHLSEYGVAQTGCSVALEQSKFEVTYSSARHSWGKKGGKSHNCKDSVKKRRKEYDPKYTEYTSLIDTPKNVYKATCNMSMARGTGGIKTSNVNIMEKRATPHLNGTINPQQGVVHPQAPGTSLPTLPALLAPVGVALLALGPGTPYPPGIARPPVDRHVATILGGPFLARSTHNVQKRYLKEVEGEKCVRWEEALEALKLEDLMDTDGVLEGYEDELDSRVRLERNLEPMEEIEEVSISKEDLTRTIKVGKNLPPAVREDVINTVRQNQDVLTWSH
uniref:Retrotransposon gag domain-containing protein n=1 Tax=Cannabis sativa TaxID=3483 RepID=A0A803P469_CANSA